jgi:hypothetical protein
MDNLIDDIRNIFNNSENKSYPVLKQGRQFIKYSDDYVKVVKPELKIIQETSSPKLASVVETLESSNSLSQKSKTQISKVSKNEQEFNRTLAEYTAAYNSYIQELLNKNQTMQKVNQYFGKAVSENDGKYSYINDFGYTHRYSTDAWLKNDASCPNTVVSISADDYKLLNPGPDMGLGQSCKIAGQNIQNIDTQEVAWVDIKGYKHIYPQEIWKNKQSSCDVTPIRISKTAFDNIPSGSPMTTTSVCSQMDVNPVLLDKLNKLNNKLVSLAKNMVSEMDNMDVSDAGLKDKLTQKKQQLNNYINQFKTQNMDLTRSSHDIITVEGERQNSERYLNYNYYHYLRWLIGLIFIILLLLKNPFDRSSNLENLALVVLLVIVLYYIYNKWFSQSYTY